MVTTHTPRDSTYSIPAAQWQEVELTFTGPAADNPYTEITASVDFTHDDGRVIRRPVFWDGGTTYRVRFASPANSGTWTWTLTASTSESTLDFTPTTGQLMAAAAAAEDPHPARRHGFTSVAPGARTAVHADGYPALTVADTAWGLPWRATVEQVQIYADDRAGKGFNTVFLMAIMPDRGTRGPRGRDLDQGFEVAFEDLPSGRLTQISVEYFQYFDMIIDTLLDHGLTPAYQPVFDGFGWKGQSPLGPDVLPDDFARFCRYLVARYGARPAMWFVCGDGSGEAPAVAVGGAEIEEWDAYRQPTGIHYRPHARNKAHQGAAWLDVQSCQTGHDGDHAPDRLATMWCERPVKAIMNGEPTYENSGRLGKASGWWQGNEAWINICAGATFGIGYGAGSLWQWRTHAEETGHEPFYLAPGAGWRDALHFEGSTYVGMVGQILDGIDLSEAEPCWDVCQRTRGLIVPGRLFICYAENGGRWGFLDADGRIPETYWIIDPRTGTVVDHGTRPHNLGFIAWPDGEPAVLICADTTPPIATRRVALRSDLGDAAGATGLPRPVEAPRPAL
ncbi:MAG TPA: DUF4038 domain-containing protein [Dermatophilaceae bacterium]|nr:DUF4038 domain-containing protein [Dermatophilaceae bacterium]